MNRHERLVLGALSAAAVLTVAACSGGSGTSGPAAPSPAASHPAKGVSTYYGEGLTRAVNASRANSAGTLTFDLATVPDSTDYQNTYDPFMWDFMRLYSMPLLTYKSCPGACGLQLVPGLATGPGVVSDHGLVWTYHIKPDVRFQNGVTVTAQDVKYGIERTYARTVLPNGPTYYQVLLQDQSYTGPYDDPGSPLTSVTTPDATTIQFHLIAPFSDFNYVVALPQSTPVLPGWDSGAHRGASFQLDPISTGPYEFQSYALNKQLVLVRNPYWNPATDPQARQLVSKIVVNMNVNQNTTDQNQLVGQADLDLQGAGVQAAARAKILASPLLKSQADDAINGLLRFAYLNEKVIPDLHCREAIEYAADKITLQDAYGGPVAGGAIASTVMPPNSIGYQKFDLYNALSMPDGDDAAATAQLKLCGQPGGFSTGLAYRSDQPANVAAARALQAALARVGIKVTLDGYPTGDYYSNFAGVPAYVHSHDLGIALGSWGADWPDGYGFLDELSDGNSIAAADNANIAEIDDPAINSLFARAVNDTSAASRLTIWPQIDRDIMAQAAILPIVYQKVLLYRSPAVTNVYVDDYYGMYNYAVLGLK